MRWPSLSSAAAIVLQSAIQASAFGAPPPPFETSAGIGFGGPRRAVACDARVDDGDAPFTPAPPPSPRRRDLVSRTASAEMGTLAASSLLSGTPSNPPPCGCYKCRLYNALMPPSANALVETTAPPPELVQSYDRPRNAGADRFFSYAMATGMEDYEAEARPYKTELFRRFFDSLARVNAVDIPSMVEIGMGTFPNADYYAQAVKGGMWKGLDIISVEPNDSMFDLYAKDSAAKSGLMASSPDTSLRNVHGVAEALPFADGSIDAIVGTLTLCSVTSQERALSEIRRVLKPDTGRFLFWEHVLSEDDPGVALQQRILSPLQTVVADGCHLDRRTGETIKKAGFRGGVEVEYVRLNGPSFLSPTVFGIASA